MSQKTIYCCDRCGKESMDWGEFYIFSTSHLAEPNTYLLCPDCSKRALEKPRQFWVRPDIAEKLGEEGMAALRAVLEQ
jgi:DNA-directed RNA polymerase subunit RPC12/RpoP